MTRNSERLKQTLQIIGAFLAFIFLIGGACIIYTEIRTDGDVVFAMVGVIFFSLGLTYFWALRRK
jgi:hypothetical protein